MERCFTAYLLPFPKTSLKYYREQRGINNFQVIPKGPLNDPYLKRFVKDSPLWDFSRLGMTKKPAKATHPTPDSLTRHGTDGSKSFPKALHPLN